MDKRINVESLDGIGTITINRPEQHNAIDYSMWTALKEAAEELGADEETKLVLLRGSGDKAFSAGADIKDFPAHRSSIQLAKKYASVFEGAMDAIETMPKPVISIIKGICIGGGCELATATDIRIASEDSTFGIPIAKIGVLAGYSEMQRLLRLVGPGNANYLLLTASIIDAEQALRIGLVSMVLPSSHIEAFVRDLAANMVQYAPLSQSGHKRIMRAVLRDPGLRNLDLQDAEFPLSIFGTHDGMEGYRAFVEKRSPRFTGH